MNDTKELSRNKWRSIHSHFIDNRFLTGKHGPCPICGGKDRFRYDLKSDIGSYYCSGCGAGTGIHLLAMTQQISHTEAWRKVESVIGMAKETKPVVTDYRKRISEILISCQKDDGQIRAYFNSRGLEPPESAMLGKYWHEDGNYNCVVFKAAKGNKLAGLHCTYLKDGKKIGRKMYMVEDGALNGSAIRLAPLLDCTILIVGEGVETVLSAMQIYGVPGWACMTAVLLEQVEIPKHIKKVVICGDNDISFTGQASAYSLAKRLKLSGLDVEVKFPDEIGKDFNDVLLKPIL